MCVCAWACMHVCLLFISVFILYIYKSSVCMCILCVACVGGLGRWIWVHFSASLAVTPCFSQCVCAWCYYHRAGWMIIYHCHDKQRCYDRVGDWAFSWSFWIFSPFFFTIQTDTHTHNLSFGSLVLGKTRFRTHICVCHRHHNCAVRLSMTMPLYTMWGLLRLQSLEWP